MDALDFLNQIKPELTFSSAILILSFGSLKVAQFFWMMEKESSSENIDRIAEISGQFKSQFIAPILIDKTKEWIRCCL